MRKGRLIATAFGVAALILMVVTMRYGDRIEQWLLRLHGVR